LANAITVQTKKKRLYDLRLEAACGFSTLGSLERLFIPLRVDKPLGHNARQNAHSKVEGLLIWIARVIRCFQMTTIPKSALGRFAGELFSSTRASPSVLSSFGVRRKPGEPHVLVLVPDGPLTPRAVEQACSRHLGSEGWLALHQNGAVVVKGTKPEHSNVITTFAAALARTKAKRLDAKAITQILG